MMNSINNSTMNGAVEELTGVVRDLDPYTLLNILVHFDLESNRNTILYTLVSLTVCLGAFLYQKCKNLPSDGEYRKQIIFEVHQICGNTNASDENLKRCVMLMNEFPSVINNEMAPYNFTPFLRACWSGNTVLVRYMLKHGANLSSFTVSGENAFYLAAYRVSKRIKWEPSILNLLADAGCPMHMMNAKGVSPLHLAARAGHVSLARWLFEHNVHLRLSLSTLASVYRVATSIDDLNHRCVACLLQIHCPRISNESLRTYKKIRKNHTPEP